MWILPTGFWPLFINPAIIVGEEEWARAVGKNQIAVLIGPNKFRIEIGRLHFQERCHSLNVLRNQPGSDGFTAVCAAQTVKIGKCFPVQLMYQHVQVFGFSFFKLTQKPDCFLFFLLCESFKLFRGSVQNLFHVQNVRIQQAFVF